MQPCGGKGPWGKWGGVGRREYGVCREGSRLLGGEQCGKGAARLQKTSQEGLHREKRLEKLEANGV